MFWKRGHFVENKRFILCILERDYPENLVDQGLGKIKFPKLPRRTTKIEKRCMFICHISPDTSKHWKDLSWKPWFTDQQVKRFFTPGPKTSFCSTKKLAAI